jgi:hypothetical protein
MAQRVKDAGESEGQAVMAWIRVQNLPGVKTSANAAFDTSSRCLVTKKPDKQLLYGKADGGRLRSSWCAHKRIRLVAPGRYREVGAVKCWRVSLSRRAFEMLERYAVKVARTVLRGGSGSNATSLPDQPTPPLRHSAPEKALVVQPVLPRKSVVLRWRG